MAGGLGTRIRPVVGDNPKCLALINNKPFIDILIDNCIDQGLRRFIISIGYKKEKVIEYCKNIKKCEIIFSEEEEQLGTGGAIKNSRKHLKSKDVIIMNGDSFIDLNFKKLYEYHFNKNSLITIAGIQSTKFSDYGSIIIDDNNRILSFNEKTATQKSNIINAGVYIFNKKIFDKMPREKNFSIEKDFFSKILLEEYYLFLSHRRLYDIGTPRRLKLFQNFIMSQNE